MLCLLVAAITVSPKATPTTYTLVPKETVWVYANASTPGDGTYLRAWGAGGKSTPPDGEDAGELSFSYLKWDLSDVKPFGHIVSAKLVLNNTPDPGFTKDSSKQTPIEVRPLIGEFDAKKWTFDMSAKIHPKGDAVLGTGYPLLIIEGKPVEISVTLDNAKFAKLITDGMAATNHALYLSLTSALDPSESGRSSIYKFYGQNESNASLRPQLVLIVEL